MGCYTSQVFNARSEADKLPAQFIIRRPNKPLSKLSQLLEIKHDIVRILQVIALTSRVTGATADIPLNYAPLGVNRKLKNDILISAVIIAVPISVLLMSFRHALTAISASLVLA